MREAQAVAALSHPNILALHDFGFEHGVHFAVMELLEGETLAERLRRGAMGWREASLSRMASPRRMPKELCIAI